jgi:hypothetical protein
MEENLKRYFLIAFIFITIITALSVVLVNIGLFGDQVRESNFAKWGMTVVLGEIVIATIALFRFEFLQKESNFQVTFTVPEKLSGKPLNFVSGTYEVRENKKTIDSGDVFLGFEYPSGALKWTLPIKVTSTSLIIMNLIDEDKEEWKLKYYPSITVELPSGPYKRR